MIHFNTAIAFGLSIALLNCCKNKNDLNSSVTSKIGWEKGNIDGAISLCVTANSASTVDVHAYCACLVDAIARRWHYQDYSKNKSNYDTIITSDGIADKCQSNIDNKPSFPTPAGQAIETNADGLVGATKPILSPDINGIPASYDVGDKKIFFSWVAGNDTKLGIRDYTVHRYELPKCAGLSIDTATILGTSLPFDGDEGKTYSFKVSTRNNGGLSAISDCSNSLTIDTTAPKNPSIQINSGEKYTISNDVLLTLNAEEAESMYITNIEGCLSGGVWEPFLRSKPWTVPHLNTKAFVYVKLKDIPGNETACVTASITHDSISPDKMQVLIDHGALYTSTPTVKLSLSASDADSMYVTNTPDCISEGVWESYVMNKAWTLVQLNTKATVYAKFKDSTGNVSPCVSSTIIHDDIAPTDAAILINNGTSYASTIAVNLSLSVTMGTQMYVTNSPDCTSGGYWESFSPDKQWLLGQNRNMATVYVKYRDEGGNVSKCVNDTVRLPWSTTTSHEPRYGAVALTAHEKAFVVGGCGADIYDAKTQIWTYATFSRCVNQVAAVTVGNKVFFASGCMVDIYDLSDNTWSQVSLSQCHDQIVGTAVGNKAIFAGGGTTNVPYSSKVDIYDSLKSKWYATTLSRVQPRSVATSVGSKAILGGGCQVDIYDDSTDKWTEASLSVCRDQIVAATVGTKVLFAGGWSSYNGAKSEVDIYDSMTGSWSTFKLSRTRTKIVSIVVGTKALFAGGWHFDSSTDSAIVDVYDSTTNTWDTASLSQARSGMAVATLGAKALFAGGKFKSGNSNVVDIYDSSTGLWSTDTLAEPRSNLAGTTIGDKVFFGGGCTSVNCSKLIDIYQPKYN